jgi:hypothetical protein
MCSPNQGHPRDLFQSVENTIDAIVRIRFTVGSEMSLEFARLDVSKLGDTHAIVMRKELCGAAPPGSDVRRSGRKRKVGECVVTGCPWGVSRQRDEVRAMVAFGTIACGSLP